MSIVFMLVLLGILMAPGALAESSTSASYRLDYARFISDSDQKTSSSYNLTDSISDISADGSSASYNLRNVYASPAVVGPTCGNGIIETGEQCEGTDFNGLTCSSYGFNSGNLQCVNCQIVTTSCFNTSPGGSDTFTCGNGKREAGEQCDDGNLLNGDGCSKGCRIEDHHCGNGIKEIGEQCDDGNVDYEDGCTPLCTIETGEEIPPEEKSEEESQLIFEPEFNPDLAFVIKALEEPGLKPAAPEEVSLEEPGLKPAAPTEEVLEEKLSYYDYHFSQYQKGQLITVLDETPFLVTQAKPNTVYEMVIFDENGNAVTRQGVKSTAEGVLMMESVPFLEYKTYGIALFDQNRAIYKNWTITIEDRKYRLHDNLAINGEISREYICLGSVEELSNFTGNGKPNTKYHAYIQPIEKQRSRVSDITHISTQADAYGDYKLEIPEKLKDGSYLMHIVQVYEDGKVQRNKRYIFNIEASEDSKNIWVLLSILLIFAIGQSCKSNKRKSEFKVRSLLSVSLVITMLIQQIAFAAVTTPTVFVYEGKLLDSSNNPITTSQTFRFSLWNSDDLVAGDIDGVGAINGAAPNYGGWFETHTLTPNTDGTFFVELGSGVPLPNMLLSTHTHLMVEIKVTGAADTAYEVMDPTGDNGTDTDDRQTVGSVPYTNNADFIDNAEVGTGAGDIATLGIGGLWNINYIPGGTNADSWTIDSDDTVGAGSTIDLFFGATLAEFLSFDITNDWFSFSNDVNFNQNQIKNVAIDNLAVAPLAPVAGQIYHNTADGNTYVWNGASWDDITAGATGVDDLDGVYGADADKKMAVNNASGLEFESSVAGDIVVDLQSTGDFVVQDAGTPFVIFTDGGSVGIGNTNPISVFHIDSNAANTAAIATLENTGGDIQFFRSDSSPEGAITGSVGDLLVDSGNGNAYIKNSGNSTNTGWIQLGGLEGKTAVFHVEYEDTTIQGDGTNNRGLLSSYFADAGGTSKYNYYEWTTRRSTMQDVDIILSFRLPEDFQSFTSTPLTILYQTSNGVLTTNQIDITLYDTTGTAVSLTGGTDLANATWTTASITFGGSPTFNAGDVVTLVIKPQTTSTGYTRVSDVIFNYNGT
ncbi:hypothetical protein JXD20_04740 [Candidatus Peregrinibacteria bacterium]|nr:hypothetical protein [Candidatus Peregrinibacteria bacterium]